MERIFKYDSVELNSEKDALIILDQRLLPSEEVFLTLRKPEEIFDAIYHLKVRGAPAIGIAAAYGLYVTTLPIKGSVSDFCAEFVKIKGYLCSARPTAVNLSYALERMYDCLRRNRESSLENIKDALLAEAESIKSEDVESCIRIAEYGFSLLKPNMGILTHCNAGHLAVSRFGTALAPIYLAQQRGYSPRVYVDETRPLLQGARLSAYELKKGGVDVTLMCDNMASLVMRQGKVDIVFVGCDRIAANGDVANKIGTSGIAVLAKYYGIPFYSLGPISTIDINTPTGNDIVIEERAAEEVTEMGFSRPIAPKGIKVFNPSFDVTPADLITGIVTQKGIFRPPYDFKKELK